MKPIKNPWIKLKETINQKDYEMINILQQLCITKDNTALKLELDYKLGAYNENVTTTGIQDINEFMYFDDNQIIGYIGICSFGGSGSPLEANGMVHPQYRGQGVFKTLNQLVIAEYKRRHSDILLLCDRRSSPGQEFIKGMGAKYKHSEYEMYLQEDSLKRYESPIDGIVLRKATNNDTAEINKLNTLCFGDVFQNHDENIIMPEDQEKRGLTIYIAEKDKQIIGKVHLQLTSNIGGIYGLCVLPDYRGRGFGRAILVQSIEKLKSADAKEVMLQVATENSNALNLYKSCGFVEKSTMDYFRL